MNALVQTELLKLRTIRSPWLILGAVQLVIIAGISGIVISGASLRQAAAQSGAMSHIGLTSLFTLLLGITAVAGEYRHKTISDTYLSTPARGQVIAAKIGVYATAGALSGAVATVVGLVTAAAWWAGKGVPFSWWDSAMWTTIGGGIAWNAAFAAIGVGLGALVRNLVGAIALALAWVALVEGLVGQLIGRLARWLPFNAGQALGGAPKMHIVSDLLPRWGGGVLLVLYTVAFAAAAVTTSVRRDA